LELELKLQNCKTPKLEFCSFAVLKTRVKAGSNTSTVTLRVVGGDEKGSLKSETVNYGHESQGTQTQERLRWQEPAAYTKDRPILSSERAPHKKQNRKVNLLVALHRQHATMFLTLLEGINSVPVDAMYLRRVIRFNDENLRQDS
jgi:hypothetical protein